MRTRYVPWMRGVDGHWQVLDWQEMDFCSLPKDGGGTIPLQWKSRASAEGWLRNCYAIWAKWEKDGGGEVPANWRPRPEPSPYANGLHFPREK